MTDLELMDKLCKFQVGAVCAMKIQNVVYRAVPKDDKTGRSVQVQPMQIIERLVQQCYGGLQVAYLVRPHIIPGSFFGKEMAFGIDMVKVMEIEIEAFNTMGEKYGKS